MAKILLISPTYWPNTGDDGMVLSVARRLMASPPGVEITITDQTGRHRDGFPGCGPDLFIWRITRALAPCRANMAARIQRHTGVLGCIFLGLLRRLRFQLLLLQGWLYAHTGLLLTLSPQVRKALPVVRQHDVLYIVGAAAFNDAYFRGGVVPRLAAIKLFHYFGKPCVMSGVGMSVLRGKRARRLLRKCLVHVDTMALRDSGHSQQLLREARIRVRHVASAGDDAFGLESDPEEDEKARQRVGQVGLDPTQAILGVHMRFLTYHARGWRIALEHTPSAAHLVDHLIDAFQVKALFYPTAFLEAEDLPGFEYDDIDVAHRVRRHMMRRSESAILEQKPGPPTSVALPTVFRMCLATGYHASVFSLSAGVPTVALFTDRLYESKLRGLFRWFDLEDCVLEYTRATPEQVEQRFRSLLDEGPGFAEKTARVVAEIRQNIGMPIQRTLELLADRDARSS